MSNTAIIILASGDGSRYRGIKQLADIDGVPMIRQVCQTAIASSSNSVVLVLGAYHDKILPYLSDLDMHVLINQYWKKGMSESIKQAIHFVQNDGPKLDSVLITLGDLPYIQFEDLDALMSLSGKHPEKMIASSYNGVIGVPAIFPKTQWVELEELEGDTGARAVLRNSKNVVPMPLSMAGSDIDRKGDLSHS